MEHTSEDCQCEGKKCTKCEEVLCCGQYSKEKTSKKDGLRSNCKACDRKKYKAWVDNKRKSDKSKNTEHPTQNKGEWINSEVIEHIDENCQCTGKKCTTCNALQCVGRYTKDWRLSTGLKSQCQLCVSGENKKWREKNKEYNNARVRMWQKNNPDKVKKMKKRRYIGNIESVRKANKVYRAKNASLIRERDRARYHKNADVRREQYHQNKDKFSIRWKEYYSKNCKQLNERSIAWRKSNPERWVAIQSARRTRKTAAGGSYSIEEWRALKAQYSNFCLCCGKQEPEIKLTADHVVPVSKGGTSYIENIQPLCQPCNSSKGSKVIDFRPKTP